MKDVLVIQNSSIEGSGNLGTLLESDGFTLHSIYAKREKISNRFCGWPSISFGG